MKVTRKSRDQIPITRLQDKIDQYRRLIPWPALIESLQQDLDRLTMAYKEKYK